MGTTGGEWLMTACGLAFLELNKRSRSGRILNIEMGVLVMTFAHEEVHPPHVVTNFFST